MKKIELNIYNLSDLAKGDKFCFIKNKNKRYVYQKTEEDYKGKKKLFYKNELGHIVIKSKDEKVIYLNNII